MRELTEAARAAAEIRKRLKAKFPAIKFWVRSDNYANGDSVRIAYVDGVPNDDVDAVVGEFRAGNFDGMNDLYEYSRRHDIPQAKYVFVLRIMSPAAEQAVKAELKAAHGSIDWDDGAVFDRFGCCGNQLIYRRFRVWREK